MMRWLILLMAVMLSWSSVFAQKEVSDDRIHDQVLMKLAGDAEVKGGGFDVEVKSGMVTLKGKVDTEKHKEKAEKLVKKIKGVTGVTNELVVSR